MTQCERKPDEACAFCGSEASEACPLDQPVFTGPPIGATTAAGECAGGETCESCQ